MSAYRIFKSPPGFALPTTSFTYSYTSVYIYQGGGGGGEVTPISLLFIIRYYGSL